MLSAVRAVLRRELVKIFRQKSRLLSSLVRPLIWLFVIGGGVGSIMDGDNIARYQQFLVPGVLGMTLLFGAMLSALTTVYDKESGVMRMMIVAPMPAYGMVVCKMLASALAGLVQVGLLCLVLLVLGFLSIADLVSPLFIFALVTTAIACAGLGMITAAVSESLDNFAAIMNFVIFPVFFLSGALYPVSGLPGVLSLVSRLNPFSYAVDLLKHALTGPGVAADFTVILDIAVLAGFSLLALLFSSWRFGRESTQRTLISSLTGSRR